MRCIAWPRVGLAAVAVAVLTGVLVPLATTGVSASSRSAIVDASQVAASLAAGVLVSSRQRFLHTWVTFFASVMLAGALTALVGSIG